MTHSNNVVGFIDCLFLPVVDREASIRWFQEKLGWEWNGFSFEFEQGPEVMLVTVNNEEDRSLTYFTDHWEGKDYEMHIATFRSNNIEQTHKTLKERGVRVDEIEMYDNNRKVFRFYDLNGNRFEVWTGWLK